MLVITGASGMVGPPTIRRLVAAKQGIRALTSRAASGERLKALGAAEITRGDFADPAALKTLMRGARVVVHIPPSVAESEGQFGFNVIEAARAEGVENFVFISCFHPQLSELRHHRNKLVVEEALIKSGLSYVILQPSMFMQNIGFIWPKIEAAGVFEWPWDAEKRYSMVDVEDLAEAIAVAVSDPRLRGGSYELCSADTISVVEMAEALGDAWGGPVRAGRLDAGEWAAQARKMGMSDWSVETVLGMCRFHDSYGYDGGNGFVLEAILGRKPTSYAAFCRRLVREKKLA